MRRRKATPGVSRVTAGTPRAILGAKRRIEQALRKHVELRHRHGPIDYAKHLDAEIRNLVGVAIGHSHARDGATHADSSAPGDPVLLVMLEQPRPTAAVRTLLKRMLRTNERVAVVPPFEVIVTGAIRGHSQTFMLRPAAPGSSVSNCGTASGTFGFLARGRSGPRQNQLFVVSNTHVLAAVAVPPTIKGVSQPGSTDGGFCPAQQVATLEQFVPIRPGAQNRIDAAAAIAPATLVRPELLFMQGGTPSFVRIGSQPGVPAVGMLVGKSGRQTGVTMGRIASTSSSVIATFGSLTALFVDQILVIGTNGVFSDFGDSGSLVWTWDATRSPIGLLFGGSSMVSFVNHIGDVLDALDVNMVV
jgi:hypothetical protein